MKPIYLLMLLLAFSCGQKETPFVKGKTNVENYIKAHMHDPASYEFVSMDSFKMYSKYDSAMEQIKWAGYSSQKNTGSYEDLMRKIDVMHVFEKDLKKAARERSEEIAQWRKDSALNAGIENKMTTDINGLPVDLKTQPVYYTTIFRARGKNKLGVLIINEYKVKLNKDYTVLSIE